MKMVAILLALGVLPIWGQLWDRRKAMAPWVQGRFVEAEENFKRMESIPDPSSGEWLLCQRAEFEIERGRFGVASSLLREAKRVMGPGSSEVLERRLGRLYWSAGQYADAEKAILHKRKWDGKNMRGLGLTGPMGLVTLGEVYLARGKHAEALIMLEEACKRAQKNWYMLAFEWVRAQNEIAIAKLRMGQTADAGLAAELAIELAHKEWGAINVPAMDALDTLGLVRIAEGNFAEARTVLAQSGEFRETVYGPEHPKVAASYLHAAQFRLAQQDNPTAIRLAKRSMEVEKAASAGGPNGRWALAMVAAGDVLARAGRVEDAKECFRSAIPELELQLGADAPAVEAARRRYSSLQAGSGGR